MSEPSQTTTGPTNRFGAICPQCLGSGEQEIGPRTDNCQRCGGYRYVFLFVPRVKELPHAD